MPDTIELSVAAAQLGVQPTVAFNQLVCTRKVRAEKIGKRWYVSAADVAALVQEQVTVPAGAA